MYKFNFIQLKWFRCFYIYVLEEDVFYVYFKGQAKIM